MVDGSQPTETVKELQEKISGGYRQIKVQVL